MPRRGAAGVWFSFTRRRFYFTRLRRTQGRPCLGRGRTQQTRCRCRRALRCSQQCQTRFDGVSTGSCLLLDPGQTCDHRPPSMYSGGASSSRDWIIATRPSGRHGAKIWSAAARLRLIPDERYTFMQLLSSRSTFCYAKRPSSDPGPSFLLSAEGLDSEVHATHAAARGHAAAAGAGVLLRYFGHHGFGSN